MIVMRMADGLGNQLFIYAFGRYLSVKHNTSLKLDISEYQGKEWRRFELDAFDVKAAIATQDEVDFFKNYQKKLSTRVTRKLFTSFLPKYFWKYVEEDFSKLDLEMFKVKNNSYLKGYFQSEIFFKEVSDLIRRDLIFINKIGPLNEDRLGRIKDTNSICLHIRRGDFVKGSWAGHYALPLSYYSDAIKVISDRLTDPVFFIFSDDFDWVKNNFELSHPFEYVDNNQGNGVEDLRLMSNCKHFIIANSSFSWWGAWLCSNPEKIVIAPKVWQKTTLVDHSHLIPAEWIKL